MARKSEEESEQGEEVEEDEALSLSDLPLDFINEETSLLRACEEATTLTQGKENEEEFNFDSWGGSLSAESEMCAADEVFFKAKFYHYASRSENGSRNISRCVSMSESMDRGGSTMDGLTSINSSRSSSTRSHCSSSSSNSFITNTTRNSRPKIRNQFHSFPSPNPQIRVSNARLLGIGNGSSSSSRIRSQKSTVWDFFRLGLVRAPEIELQDLKVRNNTISSANRSSVSRNSSSGSSSTNSSSSVKNYSAAAENQQDLNMGNQQKKKQSSFLDKRKGLFAGCKCSITAVETVPLNNIVVIKSSSTARESSSCKNFICKESNSSVQDMEKRLRELKIKKKSKEKQQGKQAMSRHRTFEWLKELSHASYVDAHSVQ
ncbi:hypothetical protein CISIN_1g039553mg [Citrus sinensis]|uniref:Uncharacterized protein n=1 Tax=Citrus sinensis TaxID=2711 RepID=A0A067GUK7_CITSI|nr:hypothetical protein CISIN_1g039553mg [Citrus sinensis]